MVNTVVDHQLMRHAVGGQGIAEHLAVARVHGFVGIAAPDKGGRVVGSYLVLHAAAVDFCIRRRFAQQVVPAAAMGLLRHGDHGVA